MSADDKTTTEDAVLAFVDWLHDEGIMPRHPGGKPTGRDYLLRNYLVRADCGGPDAQGAVPADVPGFEGTRDSLDSLGSLGKSTR